MVVARAILKLGGLTANVGYYNNAVIIPFGGVLLFEGCLILWL